MTNSLFLPLNDTMKFATNVASRCDTMILCRIKEERGHRNIFSSLNKQEREKKKLLETVIKQLRAIVTGEHVHDCTLNFKHVTMFTCKRFDYQKTVLLRKTAVLQRKTTD